MPNHRLDSLDKEKRQKFIDETKSLFDLERQIAENSGMPTKFYDENNMRDDTLISGNGGRWRKRPCDSDELPPCLEELDYGQGDS